MGIMFGVVPFDEVTGSADNKGPLSLVVFGVIVEQLMQQVGNSTGRFQVQKLVLGNLSLHLLQMAGYTLLDRANCLRGHNLT